MDEKVSSITFNNSYKAIETPYYPCLLYTSPAATAPLIVGPLAFRKA